MTDVNSGNIQGQTVINNYAVSNKKKFPNFFCTSDWIKHQAVTDLLNARQN